MRVVEVGGLPGHFLWLGMLAGLALAWTGRGAPFPLEMETDQWFRLHDHSAIPGVSLVGLRGAAGFGDGLLTVGDVDGDGRPEILIGGGRAGDKSESGAAFLVGLAGARQVMVERVFQGPQRRPGYGRCIIRGPGPDGKEWLGIVKLARRTVGLIELWQTPGGDGEWRSHPGPVETDLDDLVSACLPGDVDGDGVPDLLVACTHPDERAVLKLFRGKAGGLDRRPSRTWVVGTAVDREAELLPVGDVDLDGRADWMLARPGTTNRPAGGGSLELFLGGANLSGLQPAAHWSGGRTGDHFGSAVVLADLDGDGPREMLVGAPGSGELDGRFLIFAGQKGGWKSAASIEISGGQAGDLFGSTLAVGRFTGRPGRAELAVGAPGWHGTHQEEGAVHVIAAERLRSGGVEGLATEIYVGRQTRAEVGRVLANGGDLDGDGWDELVLGIPRIGQNPNKAGRVEILWGGHADSNDPATPRTNLLAYPKDPFVVAVERRVAEAVREPRQVVVKATNEVPAALMTSVPGVGPAPRGVWLPWVWTASVMSALGLGCGLCLWRRRIVNGERLRIARDLHDELGGHLVRLREPDSCSAGTATEAARQMAAGIERTIWSIHPGRRTLPDLACGLTDLAENLLGDLPIRKRFDVPLELPETELQVEVLDAVYRVVQEALTNVRKHSRAGEVRLGLKLETDALEVCVVDDGVGLERGLATARPRVGFGFESMTTRMRKVGGRVVVESSRPRGVTVRIRVPRT